VVRVVNRVQTHFDIWAITRNMLTESCSPGGRSISWSGMRTEGSRMCSPSWRATSATTPSAPPASERRGDNFQDFHLKAKAIIWLWLSYMCHIRSTAASVRSQDIYSRGDHIGVRHSTLYPHSPRLPSPPFPKDPLQPHGALRCWF